MIFLLNRDYVFYEVLDLARHHICEVLKVPLSAIEVKIHKRGGTLSPEFLVDSDQADGVEPKQIRELMKSVYKDLKHEMEERFGGLRWTREEYLERFRNGEEEEEDEEEAITT